MSIDNNAIKPSHYKAGEFDVIAFCQLHNINFDLGNVIKYVTRAGKKENNSELQDLNKAMEYLKSKIIKEYSNGDALMSFMAVRGEQFWLGTLLSLGDEVEVIEPEEVRRQIIISAEKILALYHKL